MWSDQLGSWRWQVLRGLPATRTAVGEMAIGLEWDALSRPARMSPWTAKTWLHGIRGARAEASRRLNLRLDTAGLVGVADEWPMRSVMGTAVPAAPSVPSMEHLGGAGFQGPVCVMRVAWSTGDPTAPEPDPGVRHGTHLAAQQVSHRFASSFRRRARSSDRGGADPRNVTVAAICSRGTMGGGAGLWSVAVTADGFRRDQPSTLRIRRPRPSRQSALTELWLRRRLAEGVREQAVSTAAHAFVPPDRSAIFNRSSSFEGFGCSRAGCHHEKPGRPLPATRGLSDASSSSSAASRTTGRDEAAWIGRDASAARRCAPR